ncbi:putative proteasome subunit beta type 1 [Toxoplasma gondii GT1]|uniref:Putative proteasome subunit beta type 1 n=3 Tax=Toxoplasma gondii TaxID=5811 RepID=S7VXS6_TOXGG|nr:putative proteasome subunit beta type 1 [Toxoplasma gondii GT1]KAF4644483.1 putative proteasome subunit beta type 1 [Toxoplasma gondii]KFH09075.1 putative proteasome subunit beta type 1 [Toxoplasma gondii VAND]
MHALRTQAHTWKKTRRTRLSRQRKRSNFVTLCFFVLLEIRPSELIAPNEQTLSSLSTESLTAQLQRLGFPNFLSVFVLVVFFAFSITFSSVFFSSVFSFSPFSRFFSGAFNDSIMLAGGPASLPTSRLLHPEEEAILPVALAAPMERRFSPYVNNGGTVVCVAGEDFAVAVGDTRLSTGFSIYSRRQSKITKLTDKVVLATSGMEADKTTLHNLLKIRIEQYTHQHRHPPSLNAIAQLLSTVLYSRRFFPFYTFNVLCGIDENGKGAVYGYDAIGSFEPSRYNCAGTGAHLIMPVLDNQISRNNQQGEKAPLTRERIVEIVKSAVASAGERDIFTGDQAEVVMISQSGIEKTLMDLRAD